MNDCVGAVRDVEITFVGNSHHENGAGQMTFRKTQSRFQFLAAVDHAAHIAAPAGAKGIRD